MRKKPFMAAIIIGSLLVSLQLEIFVSEVSANPVKYPYPPKFDILSPFSGEVYNTSGVPISIRIEMFGYAPNNMEDIAFLNFSLDNQEPYRILSFWEEFKTALDHHTYFGNGYMPNVSNGVHNFTVWGKTTFNVSLWGFAIFTVDSPFQTPTAMPSPSFTPTPTPSLSPNATLTPTFSPSTTNSLTPSPSPSPYPSPTQNLSELPYAASNFYPAPYSTNVSVTTSISISFGRPPSICSLNITPYVGIKQRVFEAEEPAGGSYIFYLSEQLTPQTTYTVTVTYGQDTAPEGYRPTTTRTWQFTTETNPPSTPVIILPAIILSVILVVTVVLGMIVYFKKYHSKKQS